jgi:hypothetical protein
VTPFLDFDRVLHEPETQPRCKSTEHGEDLGLPALE